jgi:hypothetical protein
MVLQVIMLPALLLVLQSLREQQEELGLTQIMEPTVLQAVLLVVAVVVLQLMQRPRQGQAVKVVMARFK